VVVAPIRLSGWSAGRIGPFGAGFRAYIPGSGVWRDGGDLAAVDMVEPRGTPRNGRRHD
jgi:hypothetical protein